MDKALLTLVALGISIMPIIIDASPSHLLNPDWSSHARTHVAWLLATNAMVAAIAVFLLWFRDLQGIATALISSILGGYFISILTRNLYGGTISDPGGVEETIFGIEAGLVFFSSNAVLLIVAILIGWRRRRAL